MDDSTLAIISGLLLLIGLIGTILPVLPGAPLALAGLVVFKFSQDANYGWGLIIVAGVLVMIGAVLDYILPIYMTKKLGGSKYAIWGSIIGLIVGLFFPPIGFLVGPFLGAFFAELWANSQQPKAAFKAALGSFVGFILTTGYDVLLTLAFIGVFIWSLV